MWARRSAPETKRRRIIEAAGLVGIVLLALAALQYDLMLGWAGAPSTLATGVPATVLLVLPGVAYYPFIAALLFWTEVSAIRL